jgi:hypothetical protein
MLSSRFAGIPISSSTIDGPGVPQLLNRGEQTLRAVTGSGGRLHFGMVAGIKSERWPTSNRNPWPDCVGIRTLLELLERVFINHPQNYDAPRPTGIPATSLSAQNRFSYCLTSP